MAGKSWSRQLERNESGPHYAAVLFTSPSEGWVLTRIYSTILHTRDGGETWNPVKPPFPGAEGTGFCTHAAVGSSFFVQLSTELVRSDDGGKTWCSLTKELPGDTLDGGGLSFSDLDHGCYTRQEGKIAVTVDGGKTWRKQSITVPRGTFMVNQFVTPETGWALPQFGTIHKTNDGGRTWVPQDLGLEKAHCSGDFQFADSQRGHVLTDAGVFRTDDGGKRWMLIWKPANPPSTNGPSALSFPDRDHGWVVGPSGYIEHYDSSSPNQ